MQALIAILIPLIIVVVVAIIIIAVTERFSPDPLITTIVRWVVFGVVLIVMLMKLVPLLGHL